MLSVTLLVAVTLFAIAFYYNKKNGKRLRLPPGPKRTPIFGNLPQLFRQTVIKGQAPFVTFADWAFKVGNIDNVFCVESDKSRVSRHSTAPCVTSSFSDSESSSFPTLASPSNFASVKQKNSAHDPRGSSSLVF